MMWATSSRDAIQVTTRESSHNIYGSANESAALTQYLGDLDASLADVLMPVMQRGLLRLEGYVQRLHPDAVSLHCPVQSYADVLASIRDPR